MVTKEIKQFIISQMKEADWVLEEFRLYNEYKSKHLTINHGTDISLKVSISIKIPSGYSTNELKITRKEIGFNYFHYRWLLRTVKKSCKLVDKRKREADISFNWKRFLEKNKDLKRDNKINQIID